MRNKLLIIISLIIFFSIGVLWFWQRNLRDTNPDNRDVFSLSRLQAPNIPDRVRGEFPIESSLSENSVSLPSSVPLLQVELGSPFDQNELDVIASNFNFDTNPNIVNDVDRGTTYIWTSPSESLIAYSQTRKLMYSLEGERISETRNLSQDEIISIAKDFLINKLNVPAAEFTSIFYLKENETPSTEGLLETTEQDADFYQVNFSPTSSDFKVVTLDAKTSPIYVWVLNDGTVSKSEAIIFEKVFPVEQEVKVRSFDEIVSNIDKAIVVGAQGKASGQISVIDFPENSLQNVEVNSLELVYLMDDPSVDFLLPYFSLGGTARVQGIIEDLEVKLYLSAIKE